MAEVASSGETDAVCIYDEPYPSDPGRHYAGGAHIREVAGRRVYPAMPYARVMFRRELLKTVGYYREDLGLYGWCDVEWGYRYRHHGVRSLVLHDFVKTRLPIPRHLITTAKDGTLDYREWRDKEIADPKKREVIDWCSANGYPHYDPF